MWKLIKYIAFWNPKFERLYTKQWLSKGFEEWEHNIIGCCSLLSHVQLFGTPWTAACQLSLTTVSRSLLKLMFTESAMPSNHLILCCPFSSWPQSFPASGSSPMSQLFASRGQRIEALASVLPINIQGWFPLGLTGLIYLLSKGFLSLLQHHSLKASILGCSAFFMVQFSHPYVTIDKIIALTKITCILCYIQWWL